MQGKADREPLEAKDPGSARNRRISLIILKQSLVAASKRAEENFKKKADNPAPTGPEPKKREEGVIDFP